jgi:hypothetical protein
VRHAAPGVAMFVALLAGCGVHTARPVGTTAAAPVDRSVDAPPFGRFDLAAYFADSGRANRLADSLYQLTPDPSSDIQTVTLHLTPDRRISVIDISYGPNRRYADAVANTRGRLGDPSTTHTDDDGSQYTTWQDARTRFELVGRVSNNRSAVHGRLTDLLLARP